MVDYVTLKEAIRKGLKPEDHIKVVVGGTGLNGIYTNPEPGLRLEPYPYVYPLRMDDMVLVDEKKE